MAALGAALLLAGLVPGVGAAAVDRGPWPSTGLDGNAKQSQSTHLAAPRLGWVETFEGYSGAGSWSVPPLRLLTPDGLLLVQLARAGAASDDSGGKLLIALDPDDGSEVWRQTGIDLACSPVIGPDGNVWVTRDPAGTSGGFAPPADLVALDPATGAPIEGLVFDGGDETVRHCAGSLHVAADGSIVFAQPAPRNADYVGMVRAIDPATATERWRRTGDGRYLAVPAPPSPTVDRVYVVDEAPAWDLVALDLATGDERGRLDLAAPPPDHTGAESVRVVPSALAVDPDGGVIVSLDEPPGGGGFRVRVTDAGDTLTEVWRHPGSLEAVAVTGSTIVSGGSAIRGFGLADGSERWSNQRRGAPYRASLFVDAEARVLVSILDAETPLQSLRATDGAHRWTWREDPFGFPQSFISSVGPLAADGTVFVAGDTSNTFGSPVWAVAAIRDGGPPPATVDQDLDAAAAGVFRHAGPDRFATAAALSASHFPPGVETVVIATGLDYPDALAGGAVGAQGQREGPLLLTLPDVIPEVTTAELERLEAASIVVLGGPAAVSVAVEEALAAYTDGPVLRLSGPDRFATASAISAHLYPRGSPVVSIATGLGFPDALSGVSRGAMLLVTRDHLPGPVAAELERLHVSLAESENMSTRFLLLGGPAVISESLEQQVNAIRPPHLVVEGRLAGADRFETSARISASRAFTDFEGNRRPVDTVYVATGMAFPDALSAGPVAAAGPFSPVLLVHPDFIPEPIRAELCLLAPRTVHILGGVSAVSAEVESELNGIVADGCDP